MYQTAGHKASISLGWKEFLCCSEISLSCADSPGSEIEALLLCYYAAPVQNTSVCRSLFKMHHKAVLPWSTSTWQFSNPESVVCVTSPQNKPQFWNTESLQMTVLSCLVMWFMFVLSLIHMVAFIAEHPYKDYSDPLCLLSVF